MTVMFPPTSSLRGTLPPPAAVKEAVLEDSMAITETASGLVKEAVLGRIQWTSPRDCSAAAWWLTFRLVMVVVALVATVQLRVTPWTPSLPGLCPADFQEKIDWRSCRFFAVIFLTLGSNLRLLLCRQIST